MERACSLISFTFYSISRCLTNDAERTFKVSEGLDLHSKEVQQANQSQLDVLVPGENQPKKERI